MKSTQPLMKLPPTRSLVRWFRLVRNPFRAPIPLASPGLALMLATAIAHAGDAPQWTVDDLVREQKILEVVISPADPRVVVWVQREVDEEKDQFVSQLFRHGPEAESEPLQLTHGEESSTHPRFSPDGKSIAFLRTAAGQRNEKNEEAKPQIWLLAGGEARALTEWKRGVRGFGWRDNGRIIFFAQEEPSWQEQDLKEKKDKAVVVEDEENEPPVRLFELNVKDKKVRRLTENRDRIRFLAVSPDGRHAVTFHDRSLRFEYDNAVPPHYILRDLDSGMERRLLPDQRGLLGAVVWAPDGSKCYVVLHASGNSRYIGYGTIPEVWEAAADMGTVARVPLDWERGVADSYPRSGEYGRNSVLTALTDGFVALLADGVRIRPARFFRTNGAWRREFLEGAAAAQLASVWSGAARGDAWLYGIDSSSVRPPQLIRAKLRGSALEEPVPISHLNPGFANKRQWDREIIRWRGAAGEEVEGILHKPAGATPGERRALVVMIHGGPSAADVDVWNLGWEWAVPLHLERGACVLQPNYHGSAHYGRGFLESIVGGKQYYDLPLEDIERGVDVLIERGWVDAEKIGVLGWSNGGILTLGLITRNPTRYKAAAAGAAGWEWSADTAVTRFGLAFNDYYFGAVPWGSPDRYRQVAPFYEAHKVRTPLIIFHGDADTAVPIHHGWMQFRPVQRETDTPVRFVIFPGAGHGLQKPSEHRRKMTEELAWFDRYLYGAAPSVKPWLKQGSPLAGLLLRDKAAAIAGRFGVRSQDKLVPETVEFHGIQVGRFEVTRAQFAEFHPSDLTAGQENYPASGIDYARAKAYCQWLSEVTGERWRLPNEAEAATLYGPREGLENTLDYWAGYAPNPEDASALRKESEVRGRGSLLREVGSFGGDAETGVFDLGGNVGEWVELDDGKGRVFGGSADQPANSMSSSGTATADYIGLRVVKDAKPRAEAR